MNWSAVLVITICFSFSYSFSSFAQESNIWYFGNGAGLDFRYGQPKTLLDGRIFTEEGSAVICDKTGNLLLYTDGVTVWDGSHHPIPNGFELNGGNSTTQSATIVPQPGEENIYYLFTVDEKAGAKGLCYTIIDVEGISNPGDTRLKNTKLIAPDHDLNKRKGNIIEKNVPVLSPVAEKLTVVKHLNGKDYWVICHQWNTSAWFVYPLTSKGIGAAVISRAGSVHRDAGSGHRGESIGYLMASPDGSKLASAVCYHPNNHVEIFNFDAALGTVSSPVYVPTEGFAYGLSFSPDNTKLYVSFLKGQTGIMQYDLEAEDVASSGVSILKIKNDEVYAGLQLGPDGKIYVARAAPWLDVISKPDNKGHACKYQTAAIRLSSRSSSYGLPNVVNYHPVASRVINIPEQGCHGQKPKVNLGKDTSLYCRDELVLDAGNTGSIYLWSTGDTTQKISVVQSGQYWVMVTNDACKNSDTIVVDFAEKPADFNYLPAFRPENKGFNNVFEFTILHIDEFELKVFNKTGKLIFRTKSTKKPWKGETKKGKPAAAGEYKWVLEYRSKCSNGELLKKEGIVTVLR